MGESTTKNKDRNRDLKRLKRLKMADTLLYINETEASMRITPYRKSGQKLSDGTLF